MSTIQAMARDCAKGERVTLFGVPVRVERDVANDVYTVRGPHGSHCVSALDMLQARDEAVLLQAVFEHCCKPRLPAPLA